MDFAIWAEKQFAKCTWSFLLAGIISAAILAYIISMPIVDRSISFWKIRDNGGNVPGVVTHLYPRPDARGFISMPDGKKDSEVFDLAVIADSSFLIKDAPPQYAYKQQKGFLLTGIIAGHITTIGGKKLRIHEFYQDGTRTTDTRRVLLKIVADPNIDAVVVTMNPFLYFNDFMAFSSTTQRSKLLYMDGLEAQDYVQLAKILRPSDLMMDGLSSVFPFYQRRYVISRMELAGIRKRLGTGAPFPLKGKPSMVPSYPLIEWANWVSPPDVKKAFAEAGSTFGAAMIQTNNLRGGSEGEATLEANLRTLEKWGKPAILYFPAINPDFIRKDPNWPKVKQIVERVEQIGSQYSAGNIRIDAAALTNAYPPVLYFDNYHMRSGQGFVRQFADILEHNLGMPIVRKDIANMFGPGS